MKLADLKPGDTLMGWHDTGRHSVVVGYEVVRLGKVKVFVRDDGGRESWLYPGAFTGRMSRERFDALRRDTRVS